MANKRQYYLNHSKNIKHNNNQRKIALLGCYSLRKIKIVWGLPDTHPPTSISSLRCLKNKKDLK